MTTLAPCSSTTRGRSTTPTTTSAPPAALTATASALQGRQHRRSGDGGDDNESGGRTAQERPARRLVTLAASQSQAGMSGAPDKPWIIRVMQQRDRLVPGERSAGLLAQGPARGQRMCRAVTALGPAAHPAGVVPRPRSDSGGWRLGSAAVGCPLGERAARGLALGRVAAGRRGCERLGQLPGRVPVEMRSPRSAAARSSAV